MLIFYQRKCYLEGIFHPHRALIILHLRFGDIEQRWNCVILRVQVVMMYEVVHLRTLASTRILAKNFG